MVVQTGQPIAQVARDLGINEGTLGNWVHLWKQINLTRSPRYRNSIGRGWPLSRRRTGSCGWRTSS